LVDEVVDFEGFVDVGLELWREERGFDLFEEKLADCALEFRVDL
jgi:hypothetical protein